MSMMRILRPLKKYVWVPIPFLLGYGMSALFAYKTLTYQPDLAAPREDAGIYNSLCFAWFYIGLGLSVTVLLVFAIYDLVTGIEKWLRSRSIRRARHRG